MRTFFSLLSLLFVFQSYSQTNNKTTFSGFIITTDSVPVSNAEIINTRTFKSVRTNSRGFFQTEIQGNDSLLIYHIAYKRRFLNEHDNSKRIVVETEMHELKQVDIRNDDSKTLTNMMKDIKQIARQKKLTKEEMKSSTQRATDQHGSHNEGFSQFFGASTSMPIGKIGALINTQKDKRHRKKLTSHYHLVKKKPVKRKE